MKRRDIILAILAAALMTGTGCSDGKTDRGEEIEYLPVETERYENHIEIEGQWGSSTATGPDGEYGIGDPFVMRYNGKYYLYPSTSDPCDGIKVFESEDLVNWTYKGLAVAETEATSHGAYAPEVIYYNGWFYLCQSRGGKGHYIYRSESPTEGFTLFSKSDNGDPEDIDYGNLGMGIDGSFYLSDDGKLYLLHTSTPAGLKYNEITDSENIRPSTLGKTEVLGDANLRHWIEGPGIFRRGDYSYLTYTGNHVISKGYRVAYSYAENLTDLSGFTQPVENVTLIDTDDEHYGLGHSSNVVGPDLDSVYTAYHSLVGNGPARRYNVDRYLSSGSVLTANGTTHRPVMVPASPTAEARDGSGLKNENGRYVLGETGEYFTAEYNFFPSEGQELYFGAAEKGYIIRLTDSGISLIKQSDGTESVIAEKEVLYPKARLNTVRVENGDGVGYVYLNGMRIISYSAEASAGAVGYKTQTGVEYTAFTNDVFGTSDFEAVKNFPTKFPATAYLKGENRGFSIADAKREPGGLRVGEKQKIRKIDSEDAYAVVLGKEDWVKYGVDVPSDGKYSVAARVSTKSGGAKLKITVGNSELLCTIPDTASSGSETVKVSLGRLELKKGVQAMRVEVLSGKAELITFEVHDGAEDNAEENVNLSEFEKVRGHVEYDGNALAVTGEDTHSVALWGNPGISDFEAEISFRCELSSNSDLGIMLRAENYSYYSQQPVQSWQGYYLQLSRQLITLNRYDYGEETLQAARIGDISDGASHTLSVRAESNRFIVVLDDKYRIEAADDCAFMSGRLGIFSTSGRIEILTLRYRAL